MFWTFLVCIFVQRTRKNKWWNLEKMPKHGFSGIFGRKIMFFENQASAHLDSTILHQCAWFHEKNYKVQLAKFKKYRFSGENRLFRQLLESSGYKYQFYWQMNHALCFCEKNDEIKGKSQMEICKNGNFRHISEYEFFQKSGSVTFWALPFCIFMPKIRKK